MRDEFLALADRVEALAGPDRNVDAVICITLGLSETNTVSDKTGWCVGSATNDAPFKSSAYTSSLDAAMTLVPEGAFWSICMKGETTGYSACCQERGDNGLTWTDATTPALALTAAALRALAAQGSE